MYVSILICDLYLYTYTAKRGWFFGLYTSWSTAVDYGNYNLVQDCMFIYWIAIYSYNRKQESGLLDPQLSIFFFSKLWKQYSLFEYLIDIRSMSPRISCGYMCHTWSYLTHRGRESYICIGKLSLFGANPYPKQFLALYGSVGTCLGAIWMKNTTNITWEIEIENVVCTMAAISSQLQCVNIYTIQYRHRQHVNNDAASVPKSTTASHNTDYKSHYSAQLGHTTYLFIGVDQLHYYKTRPTSMTCSPIASQGSLTCYNQVCWYSRD